MELSEQDIARGVCEHGLLKRSCEICELNKEIESLISENEDLKLKLKRYEMDLKGIVLVSSELYDMSKSALRKNQ